MDEADMYSFGKANEITNLVFRHITATAFPVCFNQVTEDHYQICQLLYELLRLVKDFFFLSVT